MRPFSTLLALIALVSGLLFLTLPKERIPQETENLKEGSGPGHPGWKEQWNEMKTLGSGYVDRELIAEIRNSQRLSQSRSTGHLLDIEEIGPSNVGGRTRAFLVDWSDTSHLLAGGVSGGVWQSHDRGRSWQSVNDMASNLSVSAIAQNPFDPRIIYYATGESAGNSAGIPGDGIYRSDDGGATFERLPFTAQSAFDYNWRVECSPVDSHSVYVATRYDGLWRSLDDGQSFQQVFRSGSRSITDIELFPDSSLLIGVHSDGIYYSPNGDSGTFVKSDTGLPLFGFSRIEMAYSDSFPETVYAAMESNSGSSITGIYRSDDGGMSWDSVGNPMIANISFAFPWYCLTLAVKPDDPDYVLAGSAGMGYSQNGGKTWIELEYSHADNHTTVFDPMDPNTFYVGNDGGIYRYNTANAKFKREDLNNGYNVTQFYAGSFFPDGIDFYGGTQDNGTQSTKNGKDEFVHIFGGDGAFNQISQQFPTIAYVSWQNGHIYATSNAHKMEPSFTKIMNELDADNDNAIDDGAWFINPFEINRQDGFQLFFPTRKRLWMSITGGSNWTPVTHLLSGTGQPFAVGVSNDLDPTVYVGGSSAMLFRLDSVYTMTGPAPAANLSNTVPDSVSNDFIGCITVSPSNDSLIYVAFTNYSRNPRIYKVAHADTDTPKWISLHSNLPAGIPVNWIEVSPLNDSVIVAATDFGLYTSIDAGTSWQLEDAIPKVAVHQVRLRHSDGKLFIFTHGRGAFTAQIPGDFSGIPSGVNRKEMEDLQGVILYPNPAGDYLNMMLPEEMKSGIYSIRTMEGQLVKSGQLRIGLPIDLSSLPANSYLVSVQSGEQKVTKKIVHF